MANNELSIFGGSDFLNLIDKNIVSDKGGAACFFKDSPFRDLIDEFIL
jgi:hypothetical protein